MKINSAQYRARRLATYLKSQGVAIDYGLAREALARSSGYRDWNTLMVSATEEAKLAPDASTSLSWPAYVCFFSEPNRSRGLSFLPGGTTLDGRLRISHYGNIDTDDAIEMPRGLKLGPDFIVTSVHSLVPNMSKYEVPWFAHKDLAPRWFREDLRCAALDDMDISVTDRGDDGGNRYWFETRVHPRVVRQLQEAEEMAKQVALAG